jgi:hypothetical protein
MHATVAHVCTIDDGVPKRSAALDDPAAHSWEVCSHIHRRKTPAACGVERPLGESGKLACFAQNQKNGPLYGFLHSRHYGYAKNKKVVIKHTPATKTVKTKTSS